MPLQRFSDLRNRAIDACDFDWIFSLDADERCTPAVRDEILALLAGPQIRCLLHSAAQLFDGPLDPGLGLVSELPPTATLSQRQHSLHADPARGLRAGGRSASGSLRTRSGNFRFAIWKRFINKMNRYSTLGVPKLANKRVSMGRRFRPWRMVVHQALYFQARLHGWLGGLCHCFWKFRGNLLSLRQALRRNASLAATSVEPLRRIDRPAAK